MAEISLATIGAIGFVMMLVLLFLGMPVGLALALVGFIGFGFISGFGQAFSMIRIAFYRTSSLDVLTVIPLFILMGNLAAEGGLSGELFNTANKWLGHLPGGLAMAVVGGCTGFAAVCGDSIATALTMCQVSLPEMRKFGYKDQLSLGTLASGGLLGFMIPPSIPFIIYSYLTEASVGKLFIAGILPGLLIAFLYVVAISLSCQINPQLGPPGPRTSWREKIVSLRGVWAVLVLFLLVLGGIYGGIFTATEAGSVGAFGALVLGLVKKRMGKKAFVRALSETAWITGMILFCIIGSIIFNFLVSVSEMPFWLGHTVTASGLSPFMVMIALLVVYIILGFFINVIAVMMITVPIVFPFLAATGIEPIWFGILCTLTIMIGQVTPPFGEVVFAIKGAVPEVPMYTIFRGVWPYVIAMVIALVILVAFPQISLVLPNLMRPG